MSITPVHEGVVNTVIDSVCEVVNNTPHYVGVCVLFTTPPQRPMFMREQGAGGGGRPPYCPRCGSSATTPLFQGTYRNRVPGHRCTDCRRHFCEVTD
jgi:hypothetical protein